MFKKNKKHLQPALISSVNQLPENQRNRLEQSWAGVFYREVFCRLKEEPFSVLYSDLPSRPNIPVNVLVGLEYLKSGLGWSDEELYDAFLYNVQVRYALGYHELGQGEFDLRTLYYFRQRLSQHMQATGANLLDQAFEQVTDEQIVAFELKTGKQRMDSTQVGSNIRQQGRLQLLVEVLQRVHRMLNETDQQKYGEVFAPYLKGHPGHYIYRLKKEEIPEHIQRAGRVMEQMLRELRASYATEREFLILERVFGEHFRVVDGGVQTKPNKELSACSLQSPDDWEATIRDCGHGLRQGYVTNIAETCDAVNPFQLITKVQVAPNNTDDTKLLIDALPKLVERTKLDTLHTDGGFGGPTIDALLFEQQIRQIQTGIRGARLSQGRLRFSDFHIHLNEAGQPLQLTCPRGITTLVEVGSQKKGFVAKFPVEECENCPFQTAGKCPVRFRKRKRFYGIYFLPAKMRVTLRRQQNQAYRTTKTNPRAAVEATIRAIKHPFPNGKLPVRGGFRMFTMMVGAAAMNNVRQIERYLKEKARKEDSTFIVSLAGFRFLAFRPRFLCFFDS